MKFKESFRQYVYSHESFDLTKEDQEFIKLIKDAILEETKKTVKRSGGSLRRLEVNCSVKFDIAQLHNLTKIERYFVEQEEFISFKFNIFYSIMKSVIPSANEYTFNFTAVIY